MQDSYVNIHDHHVDMQQIYVKMQDKYDHTYLRVHARYKYNHVTCLHEQLGCRQNHLAG